MKWKEFQEQLNQIRRLPQQELQALMSRAKAGMSAEDFQHAQESF